MELIWIALAAFVGGIASAILGWLDSETPFVPKKFGSSLVRAFIAAAGFAAAYNFVVGLTMVDILFAFLGGAGFDVLGNRGAGVFKTMFKRE